MKSILYWANDWRDTLFYSAITGIVLLLIIFVNFQVWACHMAFVVVFRELGRWMCWIYYSNHIKEKYKYLLVMSFICPSIQMIAILTPPRSWIFDPLSFLINFGVVIFTYNFLGCREIGPKLLANFVVKTYWKELWDWPRKQKPPEHRFDRMKDKIKQLLADMAPRPALLPQATGFKATAP